MAKERALARHDRTPTESMRQKIRPADKEWHVRLRPCARSRYVPEPGGSKHSIRGADGWVAEWLKAPVLICV